MKTLFLKSNILHIRTNEGEFEVSNPEVVHTSLLVQFHRKWNDGDESEWPYGVELIELPSAKVLGQRGHTNVIKGKKLARLLPKEEFKPAQPTPNFPKGGTTFTESATDRTEVESSEPQEKECDCDKVCKRRIDSQCLWLKRAIKLTDLTTSSDFHKKFVSAPSESQEELWRECLSEIDKMARDIDQYEYGLPWYEDPKSGTIQDRVMKRFTITRKPE